MNRTLPELTEFPKPVLTFEVDDSELIDANDWHIKHVDKGKCKALKKKKAKDVFYSFMFSTNTGIGVNVFVVCECGKKHDVTNYGKW